jgi:hypothetical protein
LGRAVSPEAPGGSTDEAGPSGAAPRSANKRHRLAPSVEQGWVEYRRGG